MVAETAATFTAEFLKEMSYRKSVVFNVRATKLGSVLMAVPVGKEENTTCDTLLRGGSQRGCR